MTEPAQPVRPAALPPAAGRGGALEVLAVATRLGLTSFGGPVAHVGYFRDEYVHRRGWLDDAAFAELVALCQFLPGPASSQLGVAIGLRRAGPLGGLLAFVGFTLPSAAALVLLAHGVGDPGPDAGWVRGLKLVAVAVVALAVATMWRTLAAGRLRGAIAVAGAAAVLLWASPLAPPLVVGLGALAGAALLARPGDDRDAVAPVLAGPRARRVGLAALAVFAALLVALPVARGAGGGHAVATADAFYRSGALVFGGGHVVLPLLERETVDRGWIDQESFLAGYGAAQAVPGPLFTFAAYLGAAQEPEPNGVTGAAIALTALFLPGLLLVVAVLPWWARVRGRRRARGAVAGAGAAVVGLLLAALYDPLLRTGVEDLADLAVVAAALLALARGAPAWAVVAACAAAGALLP